MSVGGPARDRFSCAHASLVAILYAGRRATKQQIKPERSDASVRSNHRLAAVCMGIIICGIITVTALLFTSRIQAYRAGLRSDICAPDAPDADSWQRTRESS